MDDKSNQGRDGSGLLRLHGDLPTRVATLTPAQRSIHGNFIQSVQVMKKGLLRTVYYLEKIHDLKIHRAMGFSSISAYANAAAGLTPSQTKEFFYLARRLSGFPEIAEALNVGDLSWSRAREIIAKTDPKDQQHWLELARALPRKELRRALAEQTTASQQDSPSRQTPAPESGSASVTLQQDTFPSKRPSPKQVLPSGKAEGDAKSLPADTPQYVTLKFTAAQYGVWSSLMEKRRKRNKTNKEMTILELLHDSEVNGGTGERQPGVTPPNYLIVMLACPDCGKAAIPTGQGEVSVGEALLRAGHCDAVIEDPEGNRRTTIPPRDRRQAFQRARFRCEARGCSNVHFLEIHHRKQVSGGGLRDMENLVVLCWQCHRDLHRAEEEARRVAKAAP